MLDHPAPARLHSACVFAFVFAAIFDSTGYAAADPPGTVVIQQGLSAPAGRGRRQALNLDPVAEKIIAMTWNTPKEGDLAPREGRWTKVEAGKDGVFPGDKLRGRYLVATVDASEPRIMILEASGHSLVRVNLEPHTGDIYGTGYVKVPVRLRKGANELLFSPGRSALRAKLVPPRSEAMIETADLTAPDLVTGVPVEGEAALVVINATERWRDDLELVVSNGGAEVRTAVPRLAPVSSRKVGFRLGGKAPANEGDYPITVRLQARTSSLQQPLDEARIALRVCKIDQTRKCTFRSRIDGSVQYYGLVPALPERPGSPARPPGLVLTLHGAGVEGIGQAHAYGARPGLAIVAATNRRPFGFDWEDWGRLDAVEVLELAHARLGVDPRRVYLTGHSMGGHGTWHLGVTYPDRFAAIGPSAGWVSMFSYAGLSRPEPKEAIDRLLASATAPSDTLALVRNLAPLGVYVLHGDADDNVPVAQARRMRQALGEFHPDFAYHEQPGAGHWWGNPCVDWPPLFDFFQSRAIPDARDVSRVDLVTASPGVSNRMRWAEIEAAESPSKLCAIHLERDPKMPAFSGTTENVARLALNVTAALGTIDPARKLTVKLDGQTITDIVLPPADGSGAHKIVLSRTAGRWGIDHAGDSRIRKTPERMGPFKAAFRDRFLLVVATHGNEQDNAWSLARARIDAETFWYRGNGSVDVVDDATFVAHRSDPELRDRGVILYGDRNTNAAWPVLLGESPVQVEHGKVTIGTRVFAGDDLACLFVRPRLDGQGHVGVISGTGKRGLRLTEQLPYFMSGVGYPDCVVVKAVPADQAAKAFLAAGYFGLDWSVDQGEFAYRD